MENGGRRIQCFRNRLAGDAEHLVARALEIAVIAQAIDVAARLDLMRARELELWQVHVHDALIARGALRRIYEIVSARPVRRDLKKLLALRRLPVRKIAVRVTDFHQPSVSPILLILDAAEI